VTAVIADLFTQKARRNPDANRPGKRCRRAGGVLSNDRFWGLVVLSLQSISPAWSAQLRCWLPIRTCGPINSTTGHSDSGSSLRPIRGFSPPSTSTRTASTTMLRSKTEDIGYNPISLSRSGALRVLRESERLTVSADDPVGVARFNACPHECKGGPIESLGIVSTRCRGLPGSHRVESLVCSNILTTRSDPDCN
jgi:hypothetical protein